MDSRNFTFPTSRRKLDFKSFQLQQSTATCLPSSSTNSASTTFADVVIMKPKESSSSGQLVQNQPMNLANSTSSSRKTEKAHRKPPKIPKIKKLTERKKLKSESKRANQNQMAMNRGARVRTSADFLKFCDVVLKYTNYPHAFQNVEEEEEEDDVQDTETESHEIKVESPLNSVGESNQESTRSTSSVSSNVEDEIDQIEERAPTPPTYEDDSWNQVTCYCGKPFAGRPMIECERCFVWLHLTCARVRKTNIPEHFMCSRCKPSRRRKRQISGNSDASSSGTNNTPMRSNRTIQHHEDESSPDGSTNTALSTEYARTPMKSPPYYQQSTPNGMSQLITPSKMTPRRYAKPRPRRPAIASSTMGSFEPPSLLPLHLTITSNTLSPSS